MKGLRVKPNPLQQIADAGWARENREYTWEGGQWEAQFKPESRP